MFNIYYADCIGREGNCLYPHKADVTDTASLAQAEFSFQLLSSRREGAVPVRG